MLRLLPISLLLVLLAAASAQAATVKVPVPPEGQMTVAVAPWPRRDGEGQGSGRLAVVGAARKGKLGVAVAHRRGVVAGGVVTLKVKGTVRGLRTGGRRGRARPSALLSKPLRAGLAAADLRGLGAATAARACGKPFSQAVFDRLGLGAAPPRAAGIATPGVARPTAHRRWRRRRRRTNQCSNGIDDDSDGQVDAPSERKLRPDPGCMNANDPPRPARCR